MCSSATGPPALALRARTAGERIQAIADPGSDAPVDDRLAAPRASPHLAGWGLRAQDDDGVALARVTVHGARVLVAAQDERFLAGSTGASHADALRGLFVRAQEERPDALVLLAASGGVRLHEANPAELALARALAALLDLRATGVPVLSLGVGDVYGGASVLASAADRIALLPHTRLGLSGPKVIESVHGRGELAADDPVTVAALFGAEARAAAGQVGLVADDADAARLWIRSALGDGGPFGDRVGAAQARLSERLQRFGRAAWGLGVPMAAPSIPLPRLLSSLFADADPVGGGGWLWRMRERPIWLTRPLGLGTFGPREANALDAMLLAHVARRPKGERPTLFLIGDSLGHEATAAAESLCVSQYLAQHAAVLALLRAQGVRLVGLLTGTGHSAAFFANALQAPRVFALPGARVVAMEPAAIARVTGLDARGLVARLESDPLVGHPVRHFASWGGIAEIVPDASCERLIALAERDT